jgi:adenine-specific DNA glycosylase
VRSFAFGEDDPMIDTNVRRVLRRVFFPKKEMNDSLLYTYAQTIIPKGKGREWNYAVMDIAALHCKAKGHSAECPLVQLHGKNPIIISKKPQKKFVGSDRYYRGVILRLLTEKGNTTITGVAKAFDVEAKRIRKIAKKMHYEGLIMVKNMRITFPNKHSKV